MAEERKYSVHTGQLLNTDAHYSSQDSAAALQFLLPVLNNTSSLPIAPTSTRLSDSCHGDKQHWGEQQPDGKMDKN